MKMKETTVDKLFETWLKQFDAEKDTLYISSTKHLIAYVKEICSSPDKIWGSVVVNVDKSGYELAETKVYNEVVMKIWKKYEGDVEKLLLGYRTFEGLFSDTVYFLIEWRYKFKRDCSHISRNGDVLCSKCGEYFRAGEVV